MSELKSPPKIVIINYGMGNLASIKNMLKKLGYASIISSDETMIRSASHLILPGVGQFGRGMEQLHKLKLVEPLTQKVMLEQTPTLGICLGMQLMAKQSEEDPHPGLSWVNADFIKFRAEKARNKITIPHMGWNEINPTKSSRLFKDFRNPSRFYFVHSYHAECHDPEIILATSNYGYSFIASFEINNLIGVQFHPEKSHKFGMQLIKNFIENY